MGKIQVGQKRPKTVDMGGFTIAPNDGATVENKGGVTAKENEKQARAKRLAEIQSMDEQEQLTLLLEEGFEEKAKALSEKLASLDADGGQSDEKLEETSGKKTSTKRGSTKKN